MLDGDLDAAVDPLQTHDIGVGAERILASLEALHIEVRELRGMLADRERVQGRLSRLHERKGSELAIEIAAAIGADEFTVKELLECARFDDGQLRAALNTIIGPFDAGITRRIGHLLAKVEGSNLPCGLRVERRDDGKGDCAVWCVVRV
jgi:hypothetical protein